MFVQVTVRGVFRGGGLWGLSPQLDQGNLWFSEGFWAQQVLSPTLDRQKINLLPLDKLLNTSQVNYQGGRTSHKEVGVGGGVPSGNLGGPRKYVERYKLITLLIHFHKNITVL